MIRSCIMLLVALAAVFPHTASAHVLHKQEATMKIVDNSANFVVSIPVSALQNVDLDGDGLLSSEELQNGTDKISAQFSENFEVYDADKAGQQALTLVVSPETHNPEAPTDYVVVMQRVFFEKRPRSLRVSFDLFGKTDKEQTVRFRATDGEESETAVFTPDQTVHAFFVSRLTGITGMLQTKGMQTGVQTEIWAVMGSLMAAAFAAFGLFRLRQSLA